MQSRPSLVLSAGAAVLGFLLVTAATSAGVARRATEPRKAELIELIERRRTLVADQDGAVQALRAEVASAQRRVSRASELDRAADEAEAALAMQAGTVAMAGKGLEVNLRDSPRQPAGRADTGAFSIHDTDLQLVVNALFAAGAEAVAVNDSRLVATSPIRAAGATIVVNFRPLNPPYKVSAIGADRRAFESSEIARRFRRWTGLFGLGFTVQQRQVTVPAYAGRVAITSARPR